MSSNRHTIERYSALNRNSFVQISAFGQISVSRGIIIGLLHLIFNTLEPKVTLQDIINQTSDLVSNYTTSTIDQGNVIRACNRAIEYVQRRLGLPSDRKIFSFYFYEDTLYNDLTYDFNEDIQLYYNTTAGAVTADNNNPVNRWNRVEDTQIFRGSGNYSPVNQYAFTTVNGKKQLLTFGKNLNTTTVLNPFNTTSNLTFSSSITGAQIDSNIYKYGGASIVFNVDNSESTSTITQTQVQWDIRYLLNTQAAYRWYVYFPTGAASQIQNIKLRLKSSTGNYYEMTTTTDYLGDAWNTNGWSLLSFKLSDATTVGTPVASTIIEADFLITHAGGFTGISNMRVNEFYVVQPDLLNLSYYSQIKGTDLLGTTDKIFLDTGSDIASFGSFAPDLIWPIAIKAATILMPQLRADLNFTQIYNGDFKTTLDLYGKSYPRKRNTVSAQSQLLRGL